jgi:membrane associated rhomboid family serine protease
MTAEVAGGLALLMHQIVVGLLIVAIGIFGAVAVKSSGIRSFQFQISVFIMIWIVGELVDIMQDLGSFSLYDPELGMEIHLASMVFFSVMLWLRFYFARQRQKKIVEASTSDYF